MKIASFSVSNYRSITTAKKVTLSQYSVLVGANNEGKSNILHALALGMNTIESFKDNIYKDSAGRYIQSRRYGPYSGLGYDWERDYPVSKQKASGNDQFSEVVIEFQLSDSEILEFTEEIGSKLNGTLPISIKFYGRRLEFAVPKQGPGSTKMAEKRNKIAKFVSERINFQYIPAVRTSSAAEQVISGLVHKELANLDGGQALEDALRVIAEIQQPLLDSISDAIRETVASFVPSVKAVHVSLPKEYASRTFRREVLIEIDDGSKTPLERKGDGVKSLVALALMRHSIGPGSNLGGSVIAIEEPEAHLHPRAVHELRDVVRALSLANQVVVTTHSPLFVNPETLASTIVVQRNKAAPAASIAEVRDVLGVRLSDNLHSARLVLIVEGAEDKVCLTSILSCYSPPLEIALKAGELVVDDMGGSANLRYKVGLYRSAACAIHCFLDGDRAGRESVEKAKQANFIRESDYQIFHVPSFPDSELEDLFDARIYKEDFFSEFGVDPTALPPGCKRKKWSDAMGAIFQSQGKMWDSKREMATKKWLAERVSAEPRKYIIGGRLGPVNALIASLVSKL